MRNEQPIQQNAIRKFTFLVIGVLPMAALIWWCGFTYQKYQYARTRDTLVEAGAPASLDRYRRGHVADSENAALVYRLLASEQGYRKGEGPSTEQLLELAQLAKSKGDAQYIRLETYLEHGSPGFYDQEDVGTFLVREMKAARKRGDRDEAARTLSAGLHWANSLVADPVWDAVSMRNEFIREFLRVANHVINDGPIDDPLLGEIHSELNVLRDRMTLQRAVGIEFAYRAQDWRRRSWCVTTSDLVLLPASISDRTHELRELALLFKISDGPYYEWREESGGFRSRVCLGGAYSWNEGLLECVVSTNEVISRADLFEIGNALLRHESRLGEYPSSLEGLIPAYQPDTPLDPFLGRPYRYHIDDKGLMVYGVGRDGVNNGGRGDDIVWKSGEPGRPVKL